MNRIAFLAAVLLLALAVPSPADVQIKHRWVYVQTNLLIDKNADDLVALMDRSAKAGYNGVMLADYKFNVLERMDSHYFANLKRVTDAAAKDKLDLIPAIFSIGYGSGLLVHDQNLAAGLPVREAPFVVRGGKIVPDDPLALANGDFEQLGTGRKAGQFAGWEWQDPVVKPTQAEKHSGKQAIEMADIGKADPKNGHGRIMQSLTVQPGRYYHLSVWIKTKDFETPDAAKVELLTEGVPALNYQFLKVKRTQDWTQHHVRFFTLNETKVRLYLGVWRGQGGTIWWDDARVEPGGFFNVLRRPGCPLKVASLDGKTVYEEGRDFSAVKDPMLGQGGFSIWHDVPPVTLPAGSKLREGDKLAISYYAPAVIYDAQVPVDLTEPKVYELLADQMKRVNTAFGRSAAGYMMSHDEIRVGGWDTIAADKGGTPGQWLADNIRQCQKIARDATKDTRPGMPLYVWSDMFDPNHNAHDKYYLVNGTWAGSWEGLDKDTVIVNWYYDKRDVNLKWFADRGHKQILAGYYDRDPERIATWLEAADKVDGVIGVMYTTWQNKYEDLEKFAAAVDGFMAKKK
jgi:hypothetical protein